MNKTISIPFGEHVLSATGVPHTAAVQKGCIFYFHGGGLVFGTSNDLSNVYLNMFRTSGYDFVSLSYPLAPESSIRQILDAAYHAVTYLLDHPQILGYDTMPPYFLFGRSAGAYLTLMTASRMVKHHVKPTGLLSFYGYHTFDLPEFHKPNPAYAKLPAVPERIVSQITSTAFVTEGPKENRYSLYIYARQTGTWPELLGCPSGDQSYGLTDTELALLPPAFFTASTGDQDVPFCTSKHLASRVPGSVFKPVYYLEHDFDRDTRKKDGRQVYEAALSWMEKLVCS